MQDNLFTGAEAREKLMNGVRKAAEAVSVTLGTSGSNSLIEVMERPGHFATNDGATILGAIRFEDPLEEMGRMVLYEAVSRANKSSGDGSSTATVLTAAILEEGMKHINEASPMDIKRSLEDCIPLIEASVNAQKKEITVDSVAQVASISAEDESIGNLIQEIYQKIGKSGIVSWDISKTAEDSYTTGTGLTVHGATYASPYMCDEGSNEARLSDIKVLLTRRKITSALEFENLFKNLFSQGVKDLVVFCEDIDVPVITDLYKTQRIRGFRTVVVKMPVLWRDEWWEDLALASGGTVIDAVSGIQLQDATAEHLGTFGHVTVTREDTYIDGIKDLTLHIADLQAEGSDASQLRASRLNTRTARYFVGAHSESALAYKRLKVEDALNAASCALENGVVAGGGMALYNSIDSLPKDTIGGIILRDALKAPLRQIIKNAGKSPEDVVKGNFKGFNSRTGQSEDLLESGIVDPTDVVLNAVRNAIGVAASILTVGTVVTIPEQLKNVPK